MIFKNNKHYDILKWFFGVVLPAVSVLYVGLSKAWEGVLPFPYPEQIESTILLIVAFADTILNVSSIKYHNQEEERNKDEAED